MSTSFPAGSTVAAPHRRRSRPSPEPARPETARPETSVVPVREVPIVKAAPPPLTDAETAPHQPDVPNGWKIRLEDPLNRYYRYPIAQFLVRKLLVRTPITPNQVSLLTL